MSSPSATTTIAQPDMATGPRSRPAEWLMFQMTDFGSNHNKFYLVELWPTDTSLLRFRASWGRVGSKPQVQEKLVEREWVEKQIKEKVRKGYRPVDLHRAESGTTLESDLEPAPAISPEVCQLLEWIFIEAGEHIRSYLAVEVEALSQEQITTGRRLLSLAQRLTSEWKRTNTASTREELGCVVQDYYNAIPTKLPPRIKSDEVVEAFCTDFNEQENRLLQLEAAISIAQAQHKQPGSGFYSMLGAQIDVLPLDRAEHLMLLDYISRTQAQRRGIRVRNIFEVTIPAERESYTRNKRGIKRRELLFHGTRNRNIRHILRQGLICPQTAANGRMLGNGIYLANKVEKSLNYCIPGKQNIPGMLLVVEAALGKPYVAPSARSFSKPPFGSDSVWGKAGYTRTVGEATLQNDEFVIFSPAQQTLRYLVTFDC